MRQLCNWRFINPEAIFYRAHFANIVCGVIPDFRTCSVFCRAAARFFKAGLAFMTFPADQKSNFYTFVCLVKPGLEPYYALLITLRLRPLHRVNESY